MIRLIAVLGIAVVGIAAVDGKDVRWPRDTFKWDEREKAAKEAVEEEKGIAYIFAPIEWGDDKDTGTILSMGATEDAIKAVKSWCVIVHGIAQALAQAEEGDVPKALMEGFQKAGNTIPLVVVLDAKQEVVLAATAGQKIHDEGDDMFRDAKKKFRELAKAREEEEDD